MAIGKTYVKHDKEELRRHFVYFRLLRVSVLKAAIRILTVVVMMIVTELYLADVRVYREPQQSGREYRAFA